MGNWLSAVLGFRRPLVTSDGSDATAAVASGEVEATEAHNQGSPPGALDDNVPEETEKRRESLNDLYRSPPGLLDDNVLEDMEKRRKSLNDRYRAGQTVNDETPFCEFRGGWFRPLEPVPGPWERWRSPEEGEDEGPPESDES
eukprot:TRINITY_DN28398_c0_g1_i1.p2 TRINITY_DN28398_c0_g1~~TRINITY_DN28398_c0_g1_i1.p2  ORF type:complete len:143 (+),score=23.90 TRINITY_DN28398_c0_g1_i1:41-469(+)